MCVFLNFTMMITSGNVLTLEGTRRSSAIPLKDHRYNQPVQLRALIQAFKDAGPSMQTVAESPRRP